jgi:sugar lactone lactonase YvrE
LAQVAASGLTTVLGLAFDEKGRLYVLESITAPGFDTPDQVGTGKVVRIDHSGVTETIATGLSLPTGITFGPDGALYMSDRGASPLVGPGHIVRITIPE